MNKPQRNALRHVVTQCRVLLERAASETLQGEFGIHPSGLLEPAETLTHLSTEDATYRAQLVVHLEHGMAAGAGVQSAVELLRRELAFTHLNRLCAIKLMEHEDRKLIREAVGRGLDSQGFKFFLADHPDQEALWSGGQADLAYRHFLESIGSDFSRQIPALFSASDPANRLFPAPRVLKMVLELLGSPSIAEVWGQDATLGWIYQYFTPKEQRDIARKESPSGPRDRYELAFLNQFYTPDYVVSFLVENTLGRMWFEMRRGQTALRQQCRFLIFQPDEILPERELREPTSLKIIDPACGSGHFLLGAFDLLWTIYLEAWDDCPALLGELRRECGGERREFVKRVPGLILEHNLFGIDIDARATQIAALALWLRAQRAFKEADIDAKERPAITRGNVIVAEPMPGEASLRDEFCGGLAPRIVGQLVEETWHELQKVEELGSLFPIERFIEKLLGEARLAARDSRDYAVSRGGQVGIFTRSEVDEIEGRQQKRFDFSDIGDEARDDAEFWLQLESRLLVELQALAAQSGGDALEGFRRALFADDAARGFAFVEASLLFYDVVLMNPPFGAPSKGGKADLERLFPRTKNDIYAAFVERWGLKLRRGGRLGAITSRTGFFLTSFKAWREEILLRELQPVALADLGAGVLDSAMVETAAYVLEKQ